MICVLVSDGQWTLWTGVDPAFFFIKKKRGGEGGNERLRRQKGGGGVVEVNKTHII